MPLENMFQTSVCDISCMELSCKTRFHAIHPPSSCQTTPSCLLGWFKYLMLCQGGLATLVFWNTAWSFWMLPCSGTKTSSASGMLHFSPLENLSSSVASANDCSIRSAFSPDAFNPFSRVFPSVLASSFFAVLLSLLEPGTASVRYPFRSSDHSDAKYTTTPSKQNYFEAKARLTSSLTHHGEESEGSQYRNKDCLSMSYRAERTWYSNRCGC